MVGTATMEEQKIRQQKTVKAFVEALGKKRSSKSLIKNGLVDKEALLDALRLAFPDITPRTMRRDPVWNNTAGCVKFSQMPETLFTHSYKGKNFGDQLKEWFDRPYLADPKEWQKAFDEFHRIACETVKDFLEKQCYEPEYITYGKAQKVVNMTFKHIYCLDGAYLKEEWFIPCHIALDSFTLEWFCRNVKGVTKGCVDSWSSLQNVAEKIPNLKKPYSEMEMYTKTVDKGEDKEPEIHKFYTYNQIVSLIRNHFANENPFNDLFPLQAEFLIWPKIQLEMAAEALYGQDVGKEDAIAEAKEKWKLEWTEKEAEDIGKQFDKCKKKFKLRPLEEKVEFLRTRVEQLCNALKQPD